MKKYYSIIGGGLTGLTIAKALTNNGITDIKIWDIKTPETISQEKIKGLHYLHDNPMNMPLVKALLYNFVKSDSDRAGQIKQDYLAKTGLKAFNQKSSVDNLKNCVEFYGINSYRKQLLEAFGSFYVTPKTPLNFSNLKTVAENSIKTFLTVPITQIIKGDFKSIVIFGKNALPAEGLLNKFNTNIHSNWVIYNTSRMEQWYRASFILGNAWMESTDPLFGDFLGFKIITNPDIEKHWDKIKDQLPNTLLVGRYAVWNRSILIHQVYKAIDKLVKDGFIK